MKGRRILVTGAAGQLGFPIAADLARDNDVWGVARFTAPGARDRLEAHGVRTAAVDLIDPDWTALPDHVDLVVHLAADLTGADYGHALRVNAEGTGLLLSRFRDAAAALVVSTTAVYDLHADPEHRFAETDPLGDSKPLFGPTYPISKIAQEAVARTLCRTLDLPITIARMNLSYGPNGGLPAYQLAAVLQGRPVTVADHDTFHNPIHQHDVIASVPRLLDVASVPATIINWAGNDTVSMRQYCAYLGELVDRPVEFEAVPRFMRSRAVDTRTQHQLIGPCALDWRDGMRHLVDDATS